MKPAAAKPATTFPVFTSPLTPCNHSVRRCAAPRERASRRVLLMRTGAHGDILMGTTLLAALRDAWPDAHITWLAEHTDRQAIDAHPYIDELLIWNGGFWKQMLRRGLFPLWLIRAGRFARQLRAKKYDLFISLQPEEWPLLLRAVHAPVTVGIFDTFRRFHRATRTSRNTRLYTHAYAYPGLPPHRVDQYLLALDALGLPKPSAPPMTLGFTEADRDAARAFLRDAGVGEQEQLIVLAPMTTWPSKCWPAERYAALGDHLAESAGCRLVLIGSMRERAAVQAIAAQMTCRPIVAAGDLSFRQMAALLAQATLVVSGDTGPMHVAAAVGTPSVALFGSTSAAWYGPRTTPGVTLSHPVPCGPCDQKVCPNMGEDYLRCLHLISVSEVTQAAERLLTAAQAVP